MCYPLYVERAGGLSALSNPNCARDIYRGDKDVEWEQAHHVQPHYVYLALSSAVKVGVTRETQVPTRWIDQGASKAILLAKTHNRYLSGVLEVSLKRHFYGPNQLAKNAQERDFRGR